MNRFKYFVFSFTAIFFAACSNAPEQPTKEEIEKNEQEVNSILDKATEELNDTTTSVKDNIKK